MPSRRRRFIPRPFRLSTPASSIRSQKKEPPSVLAPQIARAHSTESIPPPTVQKLRHRSECLSAVTVTSEHLSMILPVPPSINHQYATVNGRRLLSSAGRAYKALVSRHIWIALAQSPARASLMKRLQSTPLALSIHFYFTTPLRRDVDGGLKITQDAVCEGLGINDNRIVETHLYKRMDKLNPRIEVCLTTADSPPTI